MAKRNIEEFFCIIFIPVVTESEVSYCIYLSGQIAQVTKKENVYRIYGIDQESIGYGVLLAAYEYLQESFLENIKSLGITQDPFLLKKFKPSFAQRCEDGKTTLGLERAYVNVTKNSKRKPLLLIEASFWYLKNSCLYATIVGTISIFYSITTVDPV